MTTLIDNDDQHDEQHDELIDNDDQHDEQYDKEEKITLKFSGEDELIERKIVNDNQFGFMEKMAQLMTKPDFRVFFQEYFQNWSDIKASLMMMKTYAFIDDEYTKKSGGDKLESDIILAIMKNMILNADCRRLLVDEMDNFMQQKGTFLQYYHQAIENIPDITKSLPSSK